MHQSYHTLGGVASQHGSSYNKVMNWLWDLFFPRRCVGCRASGNYLCSSCLKLCQAADVSDRPDELALFSYHDKRVRKLLWLLKYKGIKSIADLFGRELFRHLGEDIADWHELHPSKEKIMIVPIPSSPSRQRERGFNQAAELAKSLAAHDPDYFSVVEVLQKTRNTPTQVSLTGRKERLNNLHHSFVLKTCDNALVAGQPIILIDDVSTTGATLAEARRALKASGAGAILALTVAR